MLEALTCDGNNLTSLDVSHNTALTYLNCTDNSIAALDLSRNTALEELYCVENNLTALNLSNNTSLYILSCNDNSITALTLPASNSALAEIICENNRISPINTSGCPSLEVLICKNNRVAALDLSHNHALQVLDCRDNKLTALDISANPNLLSLSCGNNFISDTSGLSAFSSVDIGTQRTLYNINPFNSAKWKKGNTTDLVFTSEADIEKYMMDRVGIVYIDENQLDEGDDFTVTEGSTVVAVKAAYLETLTPGTHTLVVTFIDGMSETDFTIITATKPATGDGSHIYLWAALALASFTTAAAILKKRQAQ